MSNVDHKTLAESPQPSLTNSIMVRLQCVEALEWRLQSHTFRGSKLPSSDCLTEIPRKKCTKSLTRESVCASSGQPAHSGRPHPTGTRMAA